MTKENKHSINYSQKWMGLLPLINQSLFLQLPTNQKYLMRHYYDLVVLIDKY